MERRLGTLEIIFQRQGRPHLAPTYDVSGLSPREQFELDTILAKIERVPTRANGRPDLRPLSVAERERVNELAERITVDASR